MKRADGYCKGNQEADDCVSPGSSITEYEAQRMCMYGCCRSKQLAGLRRFICNVGRGEQSMYNEFVE